MFASLLAILTVALTQAPTAIWLPETLTMAELQPVMAPEIRARIDSVNTRWTGFTSSQPNPRSSASLELMVFETIVSLERALFAMGWGQTAARDAAEYVRGAQPCYEWEGMPECPERKARFAEAQIGRGSPSFAHYLPLRAARSWMCVAQLAETSAQEVEAREHAANMLRRASESDDPLVRAATEALKTRGACVPR